MMAKRSDFAQKLLDDLRLRKEKLGYASSGHQPSNAASRDAYGNSQKNFRSAREASSNKFQVQSGKNMVKTNKSARPNMKHHKEAGLESTSLDIVPFGRATRSGNTIDISTALALALTKGREFQRIENLGDYKFGSELIMHRGAIHFRETNNQYMSDRARYPMNQYHFSPHMQVDEIYKGVQKLNEIIKAFSGVNFSRSTIEIGRELLRGAIDLEESLRMLAMLQENSDNIKGSRGGRVMLLKDKEEDESSSNRVKQKKLIQRTGFSIDEIKEENLSGSYTRRTKVTLTNSTKSSSSLPNQFTSHRGSLSCGQDAKLDSQVSVVARKTNRSGEIGQIPKSNSDSSASGNVKKLDPKGGNVNGKVRIPNVVAKLMGLEEFPTPKAEVEIKKEAKFMKETEVSRTLRRDTTVNEMGDKYATLRPNLAKIRENENPQAKEVRESKPGQNLEATKSKQMTSLASSGYESMNQPPKYLPSYHFTDINSMNYSNTTHTKKEAAQMWGFTGRGQITQEKAKQPIQENKLASTSKKYLKYQENAVRKKDLVQEDQTAQNVSPITYSHSRNVKHNTLERKSTVHELKINHAAQKGTTEKEQNARSKSQLSENPSAVKPRSREKSANEISKQKMLSSGRMIVASEKSTGKHTDQLKKKPTYRDPEKQITRSRSATYHEPYSQRASEESRDKKKLSVDPSNDEQKAVIPTPVEHMNKPVDIPAEEKVETIENKGNSTENMKVLENSEPPTENDQQTMLQISPLNEIESRWKEGTSTEGESNLRVMALEQTMPTVNEIASVSSAMFTDDIEDTEVVDREFIAEMNHDNTVVRTPNTQQTPQVSAGKEEEQLQLPNLTDEKKEGSSDSRQFSNFNSLKSPSQVKDEVSGELSLTDEQRLLKESLIRDQHFLNTAQALFKLNIPVSVLQASAKASQDKDSKLLLDCAYELLRRKGKREEAIFITKIFEKPTKERCLDSLIKELDDDLESLNFSMKRPEINCDTAACLQKLLEKDIQCRNPDINCMWDIGWNSITLASVEKDEVIRDLEKHILNGLVSELARDLIEV
ncbi:uncharacterized protein LOC109715164 isoform X1 [Ananas comosus]|uniref:Uncharacterized protein LOC109715164 isoform X1 n=1 Tax=Ananas comosus TaxID=4615 RepID=A0A6P5FH53_ANACO|nr:uncharacterized protein LOC109715164 isoform X1 [Ananas comosus]